MSGILEFIMAGLRHPSLISLMADDVTSEDNATWTPSKETCVRHCICTAFVHK